MNLPPRRITPPERQRSRIPLSRISQCHGGVESSVFFGQGPRERRFAQFAREFSIQRAVVGEKSKGLFGNAPRIWHCREQEQGFRARCKAYEHSQAGEEEDSSFLEEQGSSSSGAAADATESLPPAQPSIASWVLRLWKVGLLLSFSMASMFPFP